MGFLGFYNYETSGKGVEKNAPKKKRIFVFFELYFRKFWKIIELNAIWLLFSLPVLTIGPAMAGATKILRNYSQERHAFLFSDFWACFKKNFKYSFFMGLIDIFGIVCCISGCYVYPKLAVQNESNMFYVPLVIMLAVICILIIMNFYSFLMIVTTDISFKNVLKNSLFLTFLEPKINILTLFIVAVISGSFALFLYCFPIFGFVLLLFPFTLIGFIVCFNCFPVVKKYVIDPFYEARGEKSPGFSYTDNSEASDDTVFKDMGGKEAPIKKDKSKKKVASGAAKTKGKTIR